MATQNLEINKNSYVAFDATSLRDLIVNRLSKDNVFTEQISVGSNISTVIEIISYSFSTLMYYLNKTSTESMFSEAQLYENMNRIVKTIGYKPAGYRTAVTDMTLSAQNLTAGIYTIPKYSQLSLGDVVYSFEKNLTFEKTYDTDIEEAPGAKLQQLYQGRYTEFPTYTAIGSSNEIITLSVTDTLYVDHNTIDVYVKRYDEGNWVEWKRVDNISSSLPDDASYELRFNENKLYEIIFGDDINGSALKEGDQVAIYYLISAGAAGEIPASYLNTSNLIPYNSPTYSQIVLSNIQGEVLNKEASLKQVIFNNINPSTAFSSYETVDEIRSRAPGVYKSQGRLVTTQDYISFISSKFSNIVRDVRVKNNLEYLDEYIKYLYDIGLSNPYIESRVLHNQVLYANSNTSNNIYLFCLPKSKSRTYLMPFQKSNITDALEDIKCTTTNIVHADPVYISADIAVATSTQSVSLLDIDNTQIIIERDSNNLRSEESLKQDVVNKIIDYFADLENQLEPYVDILSLNSGILSIIGVRRIYCKNTTSNITVEGLSVILWNNVYQTDFSITSHNVRLQFFKSVYLNIAQNLKARVIVK
jgi:hypothetical protein